MTTAQDTPRIDGWKVERHETAPLWSATRVGGLTGPQMEFGCQPRVTANSFGELEVLTVAENIKRGIVDAAERLAERMYEADQARGTGQSWRHPGPGGGISA